MEYSVTNILRASEELPAQGSTGEQIKVLSQDAAVPNSDILPTAQQVKLPSTHPALLSHILPCEEMGSLAPNIEASVPADKEPPHRGAFVIADNVPPAERRHFGKTLNRLQPRKSLAKKKKGHKGLLKGPQVARRGNGFPQGETEKLLELLQENLPLAKDEWEKVARLHELRYPQQRRNADSIRRKFSALCRTVPPTGDPSMPVEILEAKEIRKLMTERADIGERDETDDEYTDELPDDAVPYSRAGTPATVGSSASNLLDNADGEHNILPKPRPSEEHIPTPSPRPLVRKRRAKFLDDDESIISAIKASMLQEQIRRDAEYRQRIIEREEQKERREEERRSREQERMEERELRAEERRKSEQMTQMMMIALLGAHAKRMLNNKTQPKDQE